LFAGSAKKQSASLKDIQAQEDLSRSFMLRSKRTWYFSLNGPWGLATTAEAAAADDDAAAAEALLKRALKPRPPPKGSVLDCPLVFKREERGQHRAATAAISARGKEESRRGRAEAAGAEEAQRRCRRRRSMGEEDSLGGRKKKGSSSFSHFVGTLWSTKNVNCSPK